MGSFPENLINPKFVCLKLYEPCMDKSFSRTEGRPSSQVNLRERLYEIKADPFAQAKSTR